MSWADDELAILYAEWPLGTSARLIAEKIPGKTRNAVIGRAHRDGLTSRNSPILHKPNLEARIKTMLAGNVVEAQFGGCEWLDGEPRDQNRCGKPCQRHSSYCPDHHARAWVKPPPRNRSKQPFVASADKLFGRVIG